MCVRPQMCVNHIQVFACAPVGNTRSAQLRGWTWGHVAVAALP